MPDIDSQIFSVALTFFLLIGSAKLTIEQVINLVILFKKLKATIESQYSLEKGKLEPRARGEPEETAKIIPPPQTTVQDLSNERLEETSRAATSGQGNELNNDLPV